MKFKIRKLNRANIEIVGAYVYYESKSLGLGERFLKEIEDELSYISQNPEIFQKGHKIFRQAFLKSFPFAIIFVIEKRVVTIYSVFNTLQNPTKKP